MSELVDAVQDVERAVRDVEQAVKNKWSTYGMILAMFGWLIVSSWVGAAWHSKCRYAVQYGVSFDKIDISDKPHDCAFLAAPLGEKYCHYERVVSTIRWATSTAGQPISSWDDGATWSPFVPDAGTAVPQYPTVENVFVRWEKTDD
jgi:hypothetical protein